MLDDLDFSNAEVVDAIKSKGFYTEDDLNARVTGLDNKNHELLGQIRNFKDKLSVLPADVEKLSEIGKDARFKKIIENGFDAYESNIGSEIGQRYEMLKTDKMLLEQDFKQYQQSVEQKEQEYQRSLRELKIENKLSGLVNELGDAVYSSAIPDLYAYAKQAMDFDAKGRLVVIGDDGVPRQTAEGPMTERDWVAEMKKEKPHWFRGASGKGTQVINGQEIDLDNMTPQQKRAYARRGR